MVTDSSIVTHYQNMSADSKVIPPIKSLNMNKVKKQQEMIIHDQEAKTGSRQSISHPQQTKSDLKVVEERIET